MWKPLIFRDTKFLWIWIVAVAATASVTYSAELNEVGEAWAGFYLLAGLLGVTLTAWWTPLDDIVDATKTIWKALCLGVVYLFFSVTTVAGLATVSPEMEVSFDQYGVVGIIIALFITGIITLVSTYVREQANLGGESGGRETPEERVLDEDLEL